MAAPAIAATWDRSVTVDLSALLIAGIAIAATGPTVVHRCVGADGVPRYQDQPCRDDEQAERLKLRTPPTAPPPQAQVAPTEPQPVEPPQRPMAPPPPQPMSWRCEVENGEVYYRHDFCPDSIVEPVAWSMGLSGFGGHVYLRVYGSPVSRAEACREIRDRARFGAERDQNASPYEKLSGRDLCR